MQNMFKKILNWVLLIVILEAIFSKYALAAMEDLADAGKMAKAARSAKASTPSKDAPKDVPKTFTQKLKDSLNIKAKFQQSIAGAKASIKGASPTAIKAKVAASVGGAKPVEKAPEKTPEKAPEKTPAEKEAEKQAQLSKPLPSTPQAATQEKTPAEKEAEKQAQTKKPLPAVPRTANAVTDLIKRQFSLFGDSEDPSDKGFWDKQFLKLGTYIATKFPNLSVPIMERSLKINKGFKNSPVGKFQERANKLSRDFKADVYNLIPLNKRSFVSKSDKKDIEKMRGTQQWREMSEKVRKDMISEYVRGGMSEAEATKKVGSDPLKEVAKVELTREYLDGVIARDQEKYTADLEQIRQDLAQGSQKYIRLAESAAGRKLSQAELKEMLKDEGFAKGLMYEHVKQVVQLEEANRKNIADKIDKATQSALIAEVENRNLEAAVAKKIEELRTKNPNKFAQMVGEEIEKRVESGSLNREDIAKLLQDPEFAKNILADNVKEDLKKTWVSKYQDWTQEMRQKAASFQALGIGAIISLPMFLLGLLVKKEITKSANQFISDAGKIKPAGLDLKEQSSKEDIYGSSELTPEDQKNMDALAKLAAFYSTFDEKFKKVLASFDYESTVFQTTEKVKYAGGNLTAGMVLLFDYKGVGNIAESLAPIVVRFYPMHIDGNPIDPNQALVGVSNFDALELITSLRSCDPDVLFLMKAISLINYANKKFTDLSKKQSFLNEQMNMLFMRLLRTVDEEATRRANIIEKDETKWESVYMKSPAQCFQSAPKVIRDFIADLTVDGLDEDGKESKFSFEEYVINQFAKFDDVLNVDFEGDVDYDEDDEQALDDSDLSQRILAIFSRALDDVLRIEKELLKKTDPITIKDALGKSSQLNCKKFYMDVTKNAFDNLQKAQAKIIDATIDYAADMTNADGAKLYNSAYKNYMAALDAYSKSALEVRKKVSFYPFEKTLGYEVERVFDFVKRECKRAYQKAENKKYFTSILPKIFEPFAGNFPFSTQDILGYSQEPGPVKSPVRLFVAETLPQESENSKSEEVADKTPEKVETKVTEKVTVNGSKGA